MKENNKEKKVIDPILVSVLQRRLSSITEEMAIVIVKTARSSLLAEGQDFATGIYGPKGEVWEQREKIPLLAIGISSALKNIVRYYKDEIYPEDVILHNDVFSGGIQLADMKVFRPIFYHDKLIAWSGCMGHQVDIGGAVKGGYNPQATEVWQEALRIPPIKVYENGKLRKDIWDLIFANIRFEVVQKDIQAMIGACVIGERRIKEIIEGYGIRIFESHVKYLLDSTEKMMRTEIRAIPDGIYSGESYVNFDDSSKHRIFVKITVNGDEIYFDYTGTAPQTPGYINAPFDSSAAAAFVALFMNINPDMPHNEGRLKPVHIHIPEGTILNARFPAATGFGNHLSDQNIEAVFKALSQALPERVMAGVNRHLCGILVGMDPRNKRPYHSILFFAYKGGAGGTYGVDGYNYYGITATGGGNIATDYEMFELIEPHFIVKNEFSMDSAGAGKWRGGLGVETVFKTYGEDTICVMIGDGVDDDARAFGLFGGKSGGLNKIQIISPDGNKYRPKTKEIIPFILPGSIWEQVSGGGGGYGDPFERPIEKVLEDVKNGFVSLEKAKEDYGVVIDPGTFQINYGKTKKIRSGKIL